MGIYGLSDAYDDTIKSGNAWKCIETLNKEITVSETEIETLKNTDVTVEDKKPKQWAGFKKDMMIL